MSGFPGLIIARQQTPGQHCSMLVELHVEALLTNFDLADQVWDAGVITNGEAACAWPTLARSG